MTAPGHRVVLVGEAWREQRHKQATVEWEGEKVLRVVTDDGVTVDVNRDARGFDIEPLKPKADPVNHPPHYTSDPSGVECITITRHRNFNVGNAIKYLWRAGLKVEANRTDEAKQVEDLRKAVWYVEDEIKRIEAQRESA